MATLKSKNPLTLPDTLRDLALLRVSNIDLSTLVPPNESRGTDIKSQIHLNVEDSLRQSYMFVQDARAAIRLHNIGAIEEEGRNVESMRRTLEDVLTGLQI
jgi:hypothetical protein